MERTCSEVERREQRGCGFAEEQEKRRETDLCRLTYVFMCTQLRVNDSGTFVFMMCRNGLIGLLSFSGIRARKKIFVHVNIMILMLFSPLVKPAVVAS